MTIWKIKQDNPQDWKNIPEKPEIIKDFHVLFTNCVAFFRYYEKKGVKYESDF